MSPDEARVREVVGRLTKAQREALLGQRLLSAGPGMWPLRNALARLGLVTGLDVHWTPLGLAVRAELIRQQGNSHG